MSSGYDAVVFAGGGCRCFWQAGFWTVVAPQLGWRPRAMAAVSAGVAFACAASGGLLGDVVRDFVRRTSANPRNFYLGNAISRRPMFPHGQMYRQAILSTMTATALREIQRGPQVRALLAFAPRRLPRTPALALALAAYEADRVVRRSVHPRLGRQLGFRARTVVASDSETPGQLADTILQSSCMPPITPQYYRDGEPVIDGGIIDSAPIDLVADCDSTLVLLSRRYERLPASTPRLHYEQPSQPVPIALWDYASPRLVERTFDLGRRDGERYAGRVLAQRRRSA